MVSSTLQYAGVPSSKVSVAGVLVRKHMGLVIGTRCKPLVWSENWTELKLAALWDVVVSASDLGISRAVFKCGIPWIKQELDGLWSSSSAWGHMVVDIIVLTCSFTDWSLKLCMARANKPARVLAHHAITQEEVSV